MLQNPGLTRRGLLMLATGAGVQASLRLYAGSSDFWNKKEPAEWSSEEVDKLVTKSPWARQVTASSPAMSRQYGGSGGNGGGMGDPGVGGGGGYPGGGGGYPGGGGGTYPGGGGGGYPGGGGMGGRGTGGGGRRGGGGPMPVSYTATVRWESAKPIQDALKTPLPEGLAGGYVISVSGVPILSSSHHSDDPDNDTAVSKGLSDEVLERIKNLTYLEPKGKSPAQPNVVQKGPISSSGMPTLLFGFPREVLQLTADNREILFTTKLGQIEVKSKFNLKDMMYHNELAL